MRIDISRVESKRAERDKEIRDVSCSLENVLSRFKKALKLRKERRERILNKAEKVAARRVEASRNLKSVIIKLDKTKRSLVRGKERLIIVEKEEAVLKGKYEELLIGRVPQEPDGVKDMMSDNGDDLSRRKQKFIGRITDAFDELEAEMDRIKKHKGQLPKRIEVDTKRAEAYQRKRVILAQTLKMYKDELVEYDEDLIRTIGEEELLLQEYTDFSERLHTVVSIPVSMDRLLARNLEIDGEKDLSGAK